MRTVLYLIIAFAVLGCTKARDSTYFFKCTSTYQQDPSTVISKDTLLLNYTDFDAANYARATSVNGWTTICRKQ